MAKNSSTKDIILKVWLVFSIVFIGFQVIVYAGAFVGSQIKNSVYTKGVQDSVIRILEESAKCQPFPVNLGPNKVNLIAVECLQAAQNQAEKSDQ